MSLSKDRAFARSQSALSISVRAELSAQRGMQLGGKYMTLLAEFVATSLLPVDFLSASG